MEPIRSRFVPALRRVLAATLLAFAAAAAPGAEAPLDLVPYPSSVQRLYAHYTAPGGMRIVLEQPANAELHRLGELAAEILRQRYGLRPTLVPEGAGNHLGPGILHLSLTAAPRGGSGESYELETSLDDIWLSAPSPAGIFYGLQTLRQLLASEAPIPSLRIEDRPRFAYRGLYLDVERAALPVERLESWIDLAARFKLNAVRWRLGGPEAWRLEVAGYPRLGESPGQVYSQEEVRQIVAFANARHVRIVPELDLAQPSRPVVEAYPDLGCGTVPCPGAQRFAADVGRQLAELFPPGASGLLFRRGPEGDREEAAKGAEIVVAMDAANPDQQALHAFDPMAAVPAQSSANVVGGETELAPGNASAAGLAAFADALWTAGREDFASFVERWRGRQSDATLDGDLASSPLSPP
jgi:hypothetical protein